mmetsp:Transcript_138564/g.345618  ORF Transcript_138564/g.345618 Transcript_138564/m.345618 type:complete len:203 (-) Transcript_138564:906-1514(-)
MVSVASSKARWSVAFQVWSFSAPTRRANAFLGSTFFPEVAMNPLLAMLQIAQAHSLRICFEVDFSIPWQSASQTPDSSTKRCNCACVPAAMLERVHAALPFTLTGAWLSASVARKAWCAPAAIATSVISALGRETNEPSKCSAGMGKGFLASPARRVQRTICVITGCGLGGRGTASGEANPVDKSRSTRAALSSSPEAPSRR